MAQETVIIHKPLKPLFMYSLFMPAHHWIDYDLYAEKEMNPSEIETTANQIRENLEKYVINQCHYWTNFLLFLVNRLLYKY